MLAFTSISAAAFALVHLFIGRLHFLDVVPRSRWLSFAGGVAVSYIFLHILPELSVQGTAFAESLGLGRETADSLPYLAALAGLAAFYGLERAAKTSRSRHQEAHGEDQVERHVFLLHIGSFAIYNVLIGYLLLHRQEEGLWPLMIYSIAMALHFVTNDFGLREHHKGQYDRFGRWVLAAAVVVGWLLGIMATLPEGVVGAVFAFLSGAIVLNVLKEELPDERQSSFMPFALGVAGYAALLLFAA